MKLKKMAGLIVPGMLIVGGTYALLVTSGSSSEQVALIGEYTAPRGLGVVFGLLGLGGGLLILSSALFGSKRLS